MSTVIYRKYRPSAFSDVIGQDTVINILREAIKSKKLSHAYLFAGPRGTGKTSVARLLAQAINCLEFDKHVDVCNKCSACISIQNSASLDIIEMDAASNRGIDEIRSLRDSVHFMPNSLSKKIYIIDEAHMLTKDAFNALLKTLEEPPEHVVFILATTEAHKLPVTILSRVQRYDFKLVNQNQLKQKLEKIFVNEGREVEEGVYSILYTHSNGSFRDAESLVGKIIGSSNQEHITTKEVFDILGLVNEEIVDNFIMCILNSDSSQALQVLEDLGRDEVNTSVFVDQLLERLRVMLVRGDIKVLPIIKSFVDAKRDMRVVYDKLLPLSVAVMSVCANENLKKTVSSDSQTIQAPKHQTTKITNKQEDNSKKEANSAQDDASPKAYCKKQTNTAINLETLKEFIKNSAMPILVKNQLRSVELYLNGLDLKIICEPETYSFFSNNGKMDMIKNSLINKFGLKAVSLESSKEPKNIALEESMEEVQQEIDNSDIVEELL